MLTRLALKGPSALVALLAAITVGCAAVAPAPDAPDRFVEARRLLREAGTAATAIEDPKFKDFASWVVVAWQAYAKDVPAALKTVATIQDAESKANFLQTIAQVQVEAGEPAGAARTRKQALATAIAIEDTSQKADALREIAALQMASGDTRAAVRTLERALNAAVLVRADRSEDYSLGLLGRATGIALLAADRVDAGDLPGTLDWAAAHGNDAVAKTSALVGAAAGLLRPVERLGSRDMNKLLPFE